jgi:hypothetical protein
VAIAEAAIDRLPYDYRQVFMMRTIEGLDTTETAELLGLGEDAVRQRLHRAREMLQTDIESAAGSAIPLAFGSLGRRCNRVVSKALRRLSGIQRRGTTNPIRRVPATSNDSIGSRVRRLRSGCKQTLTDIPVTSARP